MPLDVLVRNIRLVGIVGILICAATWALDLADLVYHCPYCRTQRTVIGLLGLLMLVPNPGHWGVRYLGTVFAVLGVVVASEQHFAGWKKISAGTFSLGEQWYIHPFLLSGCALFIITGQLLLLYAYASRQAAVRAAYAR